MRAFAHAIVRSTRLGPTIAAAVAITVGTDVQDDRLEIFVYGWGRDEEAWRIEREDACRVVPEYGFSHSEGAKRQRNLQLPRHK